MPCARSLQSLGQPCALDFSTVGWDNGSWVEVCGCLCCWWCHLLTGSVMVMFLFFCYHNGRRFPLCHSCWPQQAFLNSGVASQSTPLPDPKGLLLPKWTWCSRVALLAASNQACVHSFWPARARKFVAAPLVCARPSVVVPQVAHRAHSCLFRAASRVHAWPRVSALFPAHALPFHTTPQSSNASDFAAVAFSAPLARLMLAGSLGEAWYDTRDRQCST